MERTKISGLVSWLTKKHRKPLIVWGARQIGKTHLIKELFAKRYFKEFIYIDVKKDDEARAFFSTTSDAAKYISYIETRFGKKLTKDVLLMFDEVQTCHQVLSALKYFCQDFPEIPVIATGSLVRLSLKHSESENQDDAFLFPVGKVNSLFLYPVSFEEYLLNTNQVLLQTIREHYQTKTPMESFQHELAMNALHEYLTIGGMPEALDIFIQEKSYVDATDTLKEIYANYLSDMDTYNISSETILKTRNVYLNIFKQLNKENKNFKISQLEKGKSNRDYFNAYQWLELAQVVYRSRNMTGKITLPLQEEKEGLFRLYLSDVGIFTFQSQVSQADFFVRDRRNTLSGIFYENYVACELKSHELPLFYWTGKSTHEFEFITASGGKIYPIDVKKSKGGLNSLKEFRDYNGNCTAIKIASQNFGYNAEHDILTIPQYATFLLAEEIAQNEGIQIQ